MLGIRFAAAGHPLVTAVLAAVAALAWLGLTYGVFACLLLVRSHDAAVGDINGTWLLWVVATQSLSVTASTLVAVWPSQSGLLAPAAVALWSVVFPLGMYSVATLAFGQVAQLTFTEPLARFMFWAAVAAWLAVAGAFAVRPRVCTAAPPADRS